MADAPSVFTPEISAAVAGHMNADHRDDNLLIVRSLGSLPEATEATMAGISPDGAVFDAVVGTSTTQVTIPWAVPITDRGTVRLEVVRMYHDACAQLGVEPRQAGEH